VKTALDHWLLRTFVFEYRVHANVVPSHLPIDVEVRKGSHRWDYQFVCDSERAFHELTERLSQTCYAFQSAVVVRDTPYAKALAKLARESIAIRLVWWIAYVLLGGGLAILAGKAIGGSSLLNRILGYAKPSF
jgi:hypothetical protein